MTEQELKSIKPGDILTTLGGLVFGARGKKRLIGEFEAIPAAYIDPYRGEVQNELNILASLIRSKADTQEYFGFQSSISALGYVWNADTGTLERLRWRAKKGEKYERFCVDSFGVSRDTLTESGSDADDALFNSGNYFRPGTAPIEEFRDLVDGFFKKYRE